MYPGTHHAAVFEKEKAGKPESWTCKNGENPEHLAEQGDRGAKFSCVFLARGKYFFIEKRKLLGVYLFIGNI